MKPSMTRKRKQELEAAEAAPLLADKIYRPAKTGFYWVTGLFAVLFAFPVIRYWCSTSAVSISRALICSGIVAVLLLVGYCRSKSDSDYLRVNECGLEIKPFLGRRRVLLWADIAEIGVGEFNSPTKSGARVIRFVGFRLVADVGRKWMSARTLRKNRRLSGYDVGLTSDYRLTPDTLATELNERRKRFSRPVLPGL
jgi:hypothetical protein